MEMAISPVTYAPISSWSALTTASGYHQYVLMSLRVTMGCVFPITCNLFFKKEMWWIINSLESYWYILNIKLIVKHMVWDNNTACAQLSPLYVIYESTKFCLCLHLPFWATSLCLTGLCAFSIIVCTTDSYSVFVQMLATAPTAWGSLGIVQWSTYRTILRCACMHYADNVGLFPQLLSLSKTLYHTFFIHGQGCKLHHLLFFLQMMVLSAKSDFVSDFRH